MALRSSWSPASCAKSTDTYLQHITTTRRLVPAMCHILEIMCKSWLWNIDCELLLWFMSHSHHGGPARLALQGTRHSPLSIARFRMYGGGGGGAAAGPSPAPPAW